MELPLLLYFLLLFFLKISVLLPCSFAVNVKTNKDVLKHNRNVTETTQILFTYTKTKCDHACLKLTSKKKISFWKFDQMSGKCECLLVKQDQFKVRMPSLIEIELRTFSAPSKALRL